MFKTTAREPELGAMVARRDSDLLAEIERDVLDESKSVAAALRKCLALGGRVRSAALRDWASHELHGYPDKVSLPDYRKIRTPLFMEGFTSGEAFRGKQVSAGVDISQRRCGSVLPSRLGGD